MNMHEVTITAVKTFYLLSNDDSEAEALENDLVFSERVGHGEVDYEIVDLQARKLSNKERRFVACSPTAQVLK